MSAFSGMLSGILVYRSMGFHCRQKCLNFLIWVYFGRNVLKRTQFGQKYVFLTRKFKRGIGSLFDPVLTLWGGGHIGSSRMEQSYCTSGFFRQRVNARNHSNYQPTPKHRRIIAYGKRKNARRDECVAVCVICFIIF